MLKKLMSFLFEEEEEEVYSDGELEEAIFKDVPPKNIAPETLEPQARAIPRPAPKPQSVSKPQPAPIQHKPVIKEEPRKFTSIELEPKKVVVAQSQPLSRRKPILADNPTRNEKVKNEFNFAPIISPIFGSNDENNSSPLEAKVAATGGTKLKKSIDVISPMYGISAEDTTISKNVKTAEGKRHALSPKSVPETSEIKEMPDLSLAAMIKKDEEVEDDSMQISLFGEDAPIREDASSDYKIEE